MKTREETIARIRAWQIANPEKHAAYGAAWRAANPEKAKAACAAWRVANPEANKARNAAYRAANPERRAAYAAAWYADHREEQAEYALKRNYGLTSAERDEMLDRQGGLCVVAGCGMPATAVDHCHDCQDIDRRGSVRGILCHPCNRHLDHIARFSPMHAAYLAAHAATCPALAVELAS